MKTKKVNEINQFKEFFAFGKRSNNDVYIRNTGMLTLPQLSYLCWLQPLCKNLVRLVPCLILLITLVEGNESCNNTSSPSLSFLESRGSQDEDITIGFLSSFQYSGGYVKLIAGAVTLAVKHVNENKDILPRHRLKFLVGDTGQPNTALAISKMTEMKELGAVAFIGPDHSCTSEALVAAAWNLSMLAFKCSDLKVSDKEIYPTFARTLPPSSKVSKSVVALLRHYHWNKIVLVVANNTSDKQAEEALVSLAKQYNITVTKIYYLAGNYHTKHNKTLRRIVDDSFKFTRVYVLLADDHAVIDFVRYMDSLHLIDKGEYVIIAVEEEQVYDKNKSMQFMRKEFETPYGMVIDQAPFRSVLVLNPTYPISKNYESFQNDVRFYSSQPPFCIPFHPEIKIEVPIYAAMLYDAILIFAQALTEVLDMNQTADNGEAIFKRIQYMKYESIRGFSVMIDENGDAEGNYTLLSLLPSSSQSSSQSSQPLTTSSMQPVGMFTHQEKNGLPNLKLERSIDWIGGKVPLAEPKCGFYNEHCVYKPDWRLILICSVCVIVLITAASFALRHYRYEHKLACLLWKVDMKDVVLLKTNPDSTLQNIKNNKNLQGFETSRFSALADCYGTDPVTGRTLHRLAFYRGNLVHIKPVYKKNIDLSRALRKEMIQIREMRQENINPFIGACVDPPNVCVFSLFCARGSLKDILKNSDINLDAVFVASLVADLIKGMSYIHDSEIVSHGNLKSSNCLVDSRWVLQITDFGLHEFKAGQELLHGEQLKNLKGLLWMAPELLRCINPPARGSQKGDVYSFGIILHELLARKGPWGPRTMPHKCIVERVLNPQIHGGKIFRPAVQELDCADYALRCMVECWDEDPDFRPDFRLVSVKLREMLSELKTNIFDNMIAIMEKYACNLEGLVQERTHLLMEEKKKTENLLLRMLPKPVAEQLKRGEQVEAESFDSVTIYFSDIVGFTALSAVSTPLQVVDLLNDLYTCFDSIIGGYDVYKVETIGDAYMVASGLPLRNGDRHSSEVASMALHLLSAIRHFEIRHRPGERLKLRIGIHSGPCVAGVVGLKMPRYCLFGDTVNTASRMESTGEALKIHVSSACKDILENFGEFNLQERGLTQVKGKGEMRTFWLLGRKSKPEAIPFILNLANQDPSPEMKVRRYTDSRLEVRVPFYNNPLVPLIVPDVEHDPSSPKVELKLLLGKDRCQNSFKKKPKMTDVGITYSSCRNLFNECKKTINDLRKEGRTPDTGYCSTPSISLKHFSLDGAIP